MSVILPIMVLAYETDYGAVVSNTRYLEYLERGRYALLHSVGLPVEKVWAEQGVQPVVRRVEVDYLAFARHEDQLELHIRVEEHAGASSILAFELIRPADGKTVMRARQTLAYLNRSWKPVRVPALYKEKMPAEAKAPQGV